jgi:hypothetical protein
VSCVHARGVEHPLRRAGALPGDIVPILRAGRTVKVNDGEQTMRPRPCHRALDVRSRPGDIR